MQKRSEEHFRTNSLIRRRKGNKWTAVLADVWIKKEKAEQHLGGRELCEERDPSIGLDE